MKYFLDTSAASQMVREEAGFIARLSALRPSDQVLISTIVRGELLYGIERLPRGAKRDALTSKVDAILATLVCEPLTAAIGDLYAAIKVAQQNKGLSLDENDLWIAATTRHYGGVLVTRDSDFDSIEGVSVESWRS